MVTVMVVDVVLRHSPPYLACVESATVLARAYSHVAGLSVTFEVKHMRRLEGVYVMQM